VCSDPGGAVEAVEHGGVPGGGGRTLPLPLADTRPSSQVSRLSRDYISKQWADWCFSMELVVLRFQSVAEFFGLPPQLGLEPATHASEALTERYLNGSQRILGN